jgi:hypothetical protein
MGALQRKWSAFVMIEFRRLPPRRVVAAGTIGRVFACRKLSRMRVAVAAGTLFRSGAEIDIFQVGSSAGGRWQSAQATPRCAPNRGNSVFEWSNRLSSFHVAVVWQASQPATVPSGRFISMRSRNSPLCGSRWQAVHDRSSNLYFTGVGEATGTGLWQSAHRTAMWAPVRGNRVSLWRANAKRAGLKPCKV